MQTESIPRSTLGSRLRSKRLALQLSVEEVAQSLNLPRTMVDAMESDDVRALGAAVYARGRLTSYAQFVGLAADEMDFGFASSAIEPPELISRARSSRLDYSLRRFARQGIYIVLTATIVLPVVWLATHNQLPSTPVILTALDGPDKLIATASSVAPNPNSNPAAEAREEPPVVASIAPFAGYRWNSSTHGSADLEQLPAVAPASLQLRFSGDSWVDVVGVNGNVIEHGPVAAGAIRSYRASAVASVTIGNPGSVLVLRNGKPIDLKAFQTANTTRFTLSSAGKPVPVRD